MIANDQFPKISALTPGAQNLNLRAKIVSLQQRTIKNDKGETVYFYGILGDGTGTISFTAWAFPNTIQAGDVVEIKNCSTKEYNNVNRVYIDARTEVVLRPGEDIEVKRTFKELKIKDLSTSNPYVSLDGRVSNIREREMDRNGEKLKLFSADFDDDTGRIRLTSFGKPLKEGEAIRIEGAKVSEYNGRLRITINDKTGVHPTKLSYEIGERVMNLGDLNAPIGGITVQGFAVSLGQKSGLVMRCSQCNQRLDDIRCPDHPQAPFVYDLFAYFILDDGTGHVQCTGGKYALLQLLGFKEEDFVPSNTSISRRSIISALEEKIPGKAFVIKGDAVKSQMGLSVRMNSIRLMDDEFLKDFSKVLEADFQ